MKWKSLFAADPLYRERLNRYTLRDTALAMGYYVLILITYYVMGRVLTLTGRYYGEAVNIALMLLPVLLCLRCLPSTGVSRGKLGRSLIVSGAIGLSFLLAYTIIPGVISHARLLRPEAIAYNLFYYFFIIGMSEEIGFRGFIQPRLFPLFKREWLTVAVGGALFVFMHYPFQMTSRQMTAAEYWPQFVESAPAQFLWHLVFSQLYRRYDNIFGSSVLHGLVDMSMGLFE